MKIKLNNQCKHELDKSGYQEVYNDYSGEYETEWISNIQSAYKDISLGSFKCIICGHVGYYTEYWRKKLEG